MAGVSGGVGRSPRGFGRLAAGLALALCGRAEATPPQRASTPATGPPTASATVLAPVVATPPDVVAPDGAPGLSRPEALAIARDEVGRLTVPVRIADAGPFDFIVDTGSDRTVISRELSAQLALSPGPEVTVHSASGADLEPTSVLSVLHVGSREVDDVKAPLLNQSDLGAAGMLGIDALRHERVVMDFRRKRMTVEPSRKFRFDPGAIVVTAKSRFGQLILVDAKIGSVPVFVILDTGAQGTIANPALAHALIQRDEAAHGYLATTIISVTGRSVPAEVADLPEMRLGGLTLRHLPVAFADLHTFARFGLADEPAMLLGMDVLRHFDEVVVDFGRRQARFRLPEDPQGDQVVQTRVGWLTGDDALR